MLLTSLRWFGTVLVMVVLVWPFAWGVLTGDTFMTVTGRSMEPSYHVGDVIVVRHADGSELETVGNPVIAEHTIGDNQSWYVHRVHEVTDSGAFLKGDNNSVVDPTPITAEQVVGAPRFHLAGAAAFMFHVTQSWLTRGALVAVLLGGMIWSIVSSRGRERAEGELAMGGARSVARADGSMRGL